MYVYTYDLNQLDVTKVLEKKDMEADASISDEEFIRRLLIKKFFLNDFIMLLHNVLVIYLKYL